MKETYFEDRVHSEKGSIIVLLTIFMTVLIPLLALTVDGYFMLQSRMEQQNLTEYISLAALSGFNEEVMDEADFDARKLNALSAIQEIQSDNSILGLNDVGWNFSGSPSCSGSRCTGEGWEMVFGYSDGTNFIEAESFDPGDPNLIDTSNVNSILLNLSLGSNQSLARFFDFSQSIGSEQKQQIKSSSVSMSHLSNGKYRYKIIKTYAGGKAVDGDDGGDDNNGCDPEINENCFQ